MRMVKSFYAVHKTSVNFRKESLKHYTADVIFHLVRDPEQGFKINRKIINLVNSTDTLAGISYIL